MDTFGSEKRIGKFQRIPPYGHDGSKTARPPFEPAFESEHDGLSWAAREFYPVGNAIEMFKSLTR